MVVMLVCKWLVNIPLFIAAMNKCMSGEVCWLACIDVMKVIEATRISEMKNFLGYVLGACFMF